MLSEITEAGGGGDGPAIKKRRTQMNEQINPKVKQFFQKKTEIKPFYSGGKISVLSHCHFACQSGPAVNVVSTAAVIKKEEDADESLQIEDEDGMTEKKATNGSASTMECFHIISHLEIELDEIITFDACPSSHILVTSHKSTLLRIWDLDKNEVLKTVKSLHHLPIGLIDIHKVRATNSLQNKLRLNGSGRGSPSPARSDEVVEVPSYEQAIEATRSDLIWTTVSGAQLKVWEFGGNQMSKSIHIGNIASIGYATWSDDSSQRLFVAERNIYVIDAVKSGSETHYKITQTLEGHYSQVTGIEFAQGGSLMISGGRDKVLILWNIDNTDKRLCSRLKTIPFPDSIESLVLMSPQDLYVSLSPSDIRHYDVINNILSKTSVLKQKIDEPIVALYAPQKCAEDFSRDSFFATTHSTAIFQMERRKKKLNIAKQYVGCLDEILCIVFWESSEKIAVANNTAVIKVYNILSGNCELLRGHKDIVLSLDSQKNWLVSGSKDNSIILWSSDSDKPKGFLDGHLQSVTGVCFSPVQFIVFSVSEDNFLKVWDPKQASSSCLKSQLAHDKEIHTVHCSPNGALLITSSRDKTAKIWDSESLGLVATLKGHKKSVWDARFSSWDKLAVTCSADTTIKLWNLVSFNCTHTLQGHVSSVLQAMFSNSGLQICSTSSDGTMRIWDIKSSTCVATEECGDDKIWAAATQPDLSLAVTGSADSIITVWEDITEEKVKENLENRKRHLEDEQRLTNVMRSGKWQEAFRLAIELDRPFTLLKIVRELKDPLKELSPIVENLTTDLKSQLVDYIKKWNSNTKTSTEAQYLLNTILKTTSFQLLEKDMPTEAIIAYTQKHYSRLKSHRERVAVIQYFAKRESILGS